MAGAERNRTEQEVVLKARKKPLASLEELMDACLPTLTARLWATCCWPATMGAGWKIGDYNFLIASVRPDQESSLYIQFWSEPHEAVLAEVCSGEWNPGAVKYVWKQQRERIQALGYAVGGRARNFGKEFRIQTPDEAEAAAREVLGIFFEVFGYRGQWSLELQWHQGERAEHGLVYSSITLEDFCKLATQMGFEVESFTEEYPFVLLSQGKNKKLIAELSGRIPDNNLFSIVVLEAAFTARHGISDATVARLNDTLPLCRVARRGPRALILRMPLRFDGGVTATWMANAFEHWLAAWRVCHRLVKARQSAPGPKAKERRPVETVVH